MKTSEIIRATNEAKSSFIIRSTTPMYSTEENAIALTNIVSEMEGCMCRKWGSIFILINFSAKTLKNWTM